MPPSPPLSPPRRWTRWPRRLAIALIVLVAAVEIGMRAAEFDAQLPIFCTWNPAIGCITKPNLHARMAFGRHASVFSTNAMGLRNVEIRAKAPGQRRVLVLGDSVALGPQVADGAPFANLLDVELFKDNLDVVNGASMYLRATDQQLSWYLDVGATLAPDLVLLEFTERNDFADAQHQYWWRPGPHGLERQTHVEPPGLHKWVMASNEWPVLRWLDDHSRLFGLVRLGFWNIMHLPLIDTNARWKEATSDVILRLQQEAQARGARLAVVVYPSPEMVAALRGEGGIRSDNDNARILAILQDYKLPYLDLTPVLAPQSARSWVDEDGHLTVEGHKQVAALLAPKVREWLGGAPAQ